MKVKYFQIDHRKSARGQVAVGQLLYKHSCSFRAGRPKLKILEYVVTKVSERSFRWRLNIKGRKEKNITTSQFRRWYHSSFFASKKDAKNFFINWFKEDVATAKRDMKSAKLGLKLSRVL